MKHENNDDNDDDNNNNNSRYPINCLRVPPLVSNVFASLASFSHDKNVLMRSIVELELLYQVMGFLIARILLVLSGYYWYISTVDTTCVFFSHERSMSLCFDSLVITVKITFHVQ